MKQVMMSAAAHARIAAPLAAFDGLEIICMEADGSLTRGGVPVAAETLEVEIFRASLDLYHAGMLGPFFRLVLKGARGQWLQLSNAGLDNPVFRKLMEKGLRLTKSDAQAPAIAEYVLAHAISLLHPIAEQAAAQAAHDWRRVDFREIGSSRWLMLGYGPIGQAVAARLAPFGARLDVIRRSAGEDPLVTRFGTSADLPAWLPAADVVVLACPLNDATRGLADAAFFAAMKPGAVFINIARGEIVDDGALRAGLARQQPGHAVLDVFEPEPLPADSWHWDHPRVRVTAHCSNAGDGAVARGDTLFLANLRRYLAGEPLENEARRSEVGL
ncbi:MAG: NAD(P)-dependent oxidoreductase [Polymorphobacter sp.]